MKVRVDGSVFCRDPHPAWFASPDRRAGGCLEIVRLLDDGAVEAIPDKVVVNASPARTVRPRTVDEDGIFTSDL